MTELSRYLPIPWILQTDFVTLSGNQSRDDLQKQPPNQQKTYPYKSNRFDVRSRLDMHAGVIFKICNTLYVVIVQKF